VNPLAHIARGIIQRTVNPLAHIARNVIQRTVNPLAHIARNIIQRIAYPRSISQMTFYDVASTICLAPPETSSPLLPALLSPLLLPDSTPPAIRA